MPAAEPKLRLGIVGTGDVANRHDGRSHAIDTTY